MLPNDMVTFFLQVAVMLFTALLFGQLMRKIHFPAVIGELIGGIVLGPTVWGWVSPGSHSWLFPATGPVTQGSDALIQICMLFFLYAAGLEMNLGLIKKQGPVIAWTSFLGIVIPFVSGFGLVLLFPHLWGVQAQGSLMLLAFFIGTALSISALPVIARILIDMNVMKTDIGMIIMGAASIDDLIGWLLFAMILSNFDMEKVLDLPPYMTFILVILFFALMLTAGRAIGQKAQKWLKSRLPWPGGFLGISIVAVLAIGAFAEAIGTDAIFGAFLVGVAFSHSFEKRDRAHELIYQFVMCFFAPLYFVSIGLRANFIQSFDLVLVLVVLLVACAGKIIGATLGAKIGGLHDRQAAAVGFAMNARGAMVMILATVAKDVGLIDDRIFVALIIMALVTTILSGRVIDRLGIARTTAVTTPARETYRRMADFEDPHDLNGSEQ